MSDRETNDADLSLPKATVGKIITEILGDSGGVTFNKEAKDLLIDCCVEFVTLISSEANDLADAENKKTIAVEHVEKALRDLGFPEYIKQVLAAADELKESMKHREKRVNKQEFTAEEEAQRAAEQAALFGEASARYNTTGQ